MDQEVFNMSVRRFLKSVGVQSQREIEQAVTRAVDEGRLAPNASVPATMTLTLEGLGTFTVNGNIELG
ncbi:MAG: hypothetical protein JNM76_05565 [Betaproteobacteria bacterium]|nr:hypothetical protein [Betaproteobacteria bacterium]